MGTDQSAQTTLDLREELEVLAKASTAAEVRSAQSPLLDLVADELGLEQADQEVRYNHAIQKGIDLLVDDPIADALTELLLGDENRWTPLQDRGRRAGDALNVTYDGLRKRGKNGERKLDHILADLAQVLANEGKLVENLYGSVLSAGPDRRPHIQEAEKAAVFLSYVHSDDDHEGGNISKLRERLIAEFKIQTGHDLFVYKDSEAIEWGERWRSALERAIDRTTLLLVILTPSYLKSQSCRDELEQFLSRERELERDDLILPLYYVDISAVPRDELADEILTRQFVDWRDLRFAALDSLEARQAIARLARQIEQAMVRTATYTQSSPKQGGSDPSEPGLLERLASMELALPRFLRRLYDLVDEQTEITEEMQTSTEEMEKLNARGRGSMAKLVVTRRLAARLDPIASRMASISKEMETDLWLIDKGMSALSESVPDSGEDGVEEMATNLLASLGELVATSSEAADMTEGLASSYQSARSMAGVLAQPLDTIRQATMIISKCRDMFTTWERDLRLAADARIERMGGIEEAPPMPDHLAGYKTDGEPIETSIRLFTSSPGSLVPDLHLAMNGCERYRHTLRWRVLSASTRIVIHECHYNYDPASPSPFPPVADLPVAQEGRSGLWEGSACVKPVFRLADPEPPSTLVDVVVEVQRWRAAP